MIAFFMALVSAAIILAYWGMCRTKSLVHREKAAQLIISYMDRDDVSEADKDSAYFMYMFARSWFFMPITTLIGVPIMAFKLFFGRVESMVPPADERQEIVEPIMKMYMTRNPLTAMVCLAVFSIFLAVIVPIGLISNKLKAIPSLISIYSMATLKMPHSEKRHAH